MSPHDQTNDDQPVGRLLTRREALLLFGGAGAVALLGGGMLRLTTARATGSATPTPAATGAAVPACVVRPALTEGPYFVDTGLDRSDIRGELGDDTLVAGALLKLTFRIFDVSGGACTPLPGVMVDIWHCDVDGIYSGVRDRFADTRGLSFLRGYQLTDQQGEARFTTIYPGWYPGRTVHIHFKIRTGPDAAQGYDFTSQLFFDDAFTDVVYAEAPYNARGPRSTRNLQDGIYRGSEGLLTLDVRANDDEEEGGYSAVFAIGLDLAGAGATAGGPGVSGAAGWPANA